MGQSSSSTAFQNSTQPLFSSRRSHNKHPSPLAAPQEVAPAVAPPPKSPTYVVAENKVLPNGVDDINMARKLLRPVSQELSKVHPEFADIFQKSSEDVDDNSSSINESLNVSLDNKENVSLNTPRKLSESRAIANGRVGHFRKQSVSSENITDFYKNTPTKDDTASDPINLRNHGDGDTNPVNENVKMASNLLRSQSLGLSASQPVHLPKHKRQISLASNPIQEHVIPEDPREHLYNPARSVPFSNFQPSLTSLPVKSSFDIDYSLQLTYAQLAEYRRVKRTSELEEKTGKMLGQLEAEISASSNVPKSPFDLQNRGVRSTTHSVSTRSSDTGVSKSKKKKAPAPPPPQLATKVNSTASEPPPDYDTKDSPAVSSLQSSKFLQRSISSASSSSKPPAPQPSLKSASSVSLSRPGSTASPTVLPAEDLPASSVTLPRTGLSRDQNVGVSPDALNEESSNVLVQKSIAQAKAQLEAIKKLQDILNKPATETNRKENEISNASASDSDDGVADLMSVVEKETALNNDTASKETIGQNLSQTEDLKQETIQADLHQTKVDHPEIQQIQPHHSRTDQSSSTVTSYSLSTILPADKEPAKRIDPLLQKDIIFAARARKAKSEVPEATYERHEKQAAEIREEKRAAETKEKEQHKDTGNDTRSKDCTSEIQEEKTVLQSDFLAVNKKIASSEFDKSSSINTSKQNMEFGSTSSTNSVDKFSDKQLQLDNSLDQEDRSSSMSVDFSKRSSIQSENMSISSSNASGRVFSPDWAPEHDLDSDDDIMDSSSTKVERRVSSEGFKVSVVPPKVTDLYETPKKKSHKGSKKRNDTKEASSSPSNDKSKFGSLRKFKKGMKNAFGSISKASGAILNKQKSHDLSDNLETSSRQSAELTNDAPGFFRNPNWILSRSVDGSLHRRTLSDGFFSQQSVKIPEHSDVSDNSEDDLGDIDFAGGINDIPDKDSNSRRRKSADDNESASKRTGEERVKITGQIIPSELHKEHRGEPQGLKGNGRTKKEDEEFGARYMNVHKEDTQYIKASSSRKHENNKLEALLAKMIAEKEQQYESEILRRQEIENNFRRLRDLEEHEIRQKLQNEIAHEEMRKLHHQRLLVQGGNEVNNNELRMSSLSQFIPETSGSTLNNSHLNSQNSPTTGIGFNNKSVILAPLNNLGAASNGVGIKAAYTNTNQLSLPFQYLANANASLLQTGYLDSPINFQNMTGVQPSYSLPSLSPAAIGQSISPIGVTHVSYIPTFGSGGGVNDRFTNSNIPNLTQQELVYLGEYMRTIGVPPPANQHEWAVLLNSVGYKTSTLPLIGPKTFPIVTNGPDLSSVFGNQNSLNNPTPSFTPNITELTPNLQSQHPNKNQSQIIHIDETTQNSSQHHNYTNNSSLISEHSQNTPPNNTTETNVVHVTEIRSQPSRSASSTSVEPSAKIASQSPRNAASPSVEPSAKISFQSPRNASSPTIEPSAMIGTTKYFTSVEHYPPPEKHQPHTSTETSTQSDSQTVNSENFPPSSKVPTGTSARTTLLPANVYGPLGFRPVTFNPSPK